MPVLTQPLYMLVAGAAAIVVVALHLLAWRRPTPVRFPTARFVPPSAVRAVSRALRPSDLLLLAVRVLALLLAGLALARPAVTASPRGAARVLVIDASRRVTSVQAAIDSARAHAGGADELSWVRVDSVARVYADSVPDARSTARGALGAGMVAAVREALRLARTRDSVEIVVVSPFAAESWSAAMPRLRAEWGGALRVVRMPIAQGDAGAGAALRARAAAVLPPLDDPIGAAFALAIDSAVPAIRVTREAPTAGDSAWARGGGVLVWWPRASAGDGARSGTSAATADVAILASAWGSVAGHFAPLDRATPAGEAILRWSDGAVAASEHPLANGCMRTVAVSVPESGDEVLRPGFVRLVRSLAEPCGGGGAFAVPDSVLADWAAGAGMDAGASAVNASVTEVRPRTGEAGAGVRARDAESRPHSPTITRALLLAVALLLLLEWWLRRTRDQQVARVARAAPVRREAA